MVSSSSVLGDFLDIKVNSSMEKGMEIIKKGKPALNKNYYGVADCGKPNSRLNIYIDAMFG